MKNLWTIPLIIVITAVVVGGATYALVSSKISKDQQVLMNQVNDLQKQVSQKPVIPQTNNSIVTDETAGWKTYTNSQYGFSFKYPSEWLLAEKTENYGDARRMAIQLNYENGTNTFNSYTVEVLDSDGKTTRQFATDYYSGMEGGPSDIQDSTINGQSVVKVFMTKASITPAGSAEILFQKGSTIVVISASRQQSTSITMKDKILNQIAGTLQFTK